MYPNTRPTLIDRLRDSNSSGRWNSSWEEFFDLYHQAVRVCVRGAFQKNGWYSVNEADVQEVVMAVFESILKGRASLEVDPSKGRFRGFLSRVCQRRVVDRIRCHKGYSERRPSETELTKAVPHEEAAACEEFEEKEAKAFQYAVLGTLLVELHREVSPRVYLSLFLVKVMGKSPAAVGSLLGAERGVVDNSIYKAMQKLHEIAQRPEMEDEYQQLIRGEQGNDGLSLAAMLADKELTELRKAYHEMEAFQLSDTHREAKRALETKLSESTEQEPQPN